MILAFEQGAAETHAEYQDRRPELSANLCLDEMISYRVHKKIIVESANKLG